MNSKKGCHNNTEFVEFSNIEEFLNTPLDLNIDLDLDKILSDPIEFQDFSILEIPILDPDLDKVFGELIEIPEFSISDFPFLEFSPFDPQAGSEDSKKRRRNKRKPIKGAKLLWQDI